MGVPGGGSDSAAREPIEAERRTDDPAAAPTFARAPAETRPSVDGRLRLQPLPARAFAGWSVLLALAIAATRWPLRSQYLFSWDAANFAFALDLYSVPAHRPHPPGYPLYVAAAWLVRGLTGDANAAYVVLSIAASAAATVLLLGLAWRLYGPRVAALATALFVVSPNTWGHGEVAYPYAFLALGALGVAWCAVEARGGRPGFVLAGALVLGLAAGFRPDLLLLLLPTWLYGSVPLGWRWRAGGLLVLGTAVAAWLGPMLALGGGGSAYVTAAQAYAEFWAPPSGGSLVAFGVAVGRNVAELASFGARSLGPVWALLLLFGVGRLFAPRALAADSRSRLLLLWMLPPLAFYTLVHLGNLGYLLSVLPAAAMLGALTSRDLGQEVAALVRAASPHQARLAATLAALVVGLSCVAEAVLFFAGRGAVSWTEIRQVDARLQAKVAYLSKLPPERTLVFAYDRYRQLAYYLPALRRADHIRSLNTLLGPDTHPLNRVTVALPPGVQRVVLADLDVDTADRPTGLRRVDLAPGVWVYEARAGPGGRVRVGYAFARLIEDEPGGEGPATAGDAL